MKNISRDMFDARFGGLFMSGAFSKEYQVAPSLRLGATQRVVMTFETFQVTSS